MRDLRRPHFVGWPRCCIQGCGGRLACGVVFCGRDTAGTAAFRPLYPFPPLNMESSTTKSAAKPVETFRLKGISASIFENQSEDGKTTFHKVSLQRSYRQDDQWKQTQSLSRDDLPIAQLMLQKAWEFILQAEAKKNADEPKE
jgi:hypothetical protein